PGGAEANLSAVIVALTRAFPEYGDRGVRALPAQPAVYLSREAHDSFGKIAHMTGIGRDALRTVATDADLRMDVGDLARRVDEDSRRGFAPLLVVATAAMQAGGAAEAPMRGAAVCGARGVRRACVRPPGDGAPVSPPRARAPT